MGPKVGNGDWRPKWGLETKVGTENLSGDREPKCGLSTKVGTEVQSGNQGLLLVAAGTKPQRKAITKEFREQQSPMYFCSFQKICLQSHSQVTM